jgi:adenylate cyclase
VAIIVPTCMVLTSPWTDAYFARWQVLTFSAMVLFFASPTHAIFEFFAVSRAMVPTILRLSRALGSPLAPGYQRRLIAVRLKSKLLYLAIFVTALPLVFFAASVIFKVERIMLTRGINVALSDMLPLYLWVGGLVIICMAGSVIMALLTANEVSSSATRLVEAMGEVEKNRLDRVRLDVVSTDEYAEINRGFLMMVEALQEEQRILAISHDLAGELQLDLLIARIMHETTQLLNAERSTLFVHDPKTGELFSLYAEGDGLREIRIPVDRGIAGAVFASGVMENISDPYEDPRFGKEVDRRTGFITRSILCAPISNKAGTRIGVTQVLNKRQGAFNPRDEARLRAFSAQIAVCLENARLFEDVLNIKNYNESILKSTSNGIITLDADNVIVTANDAAVALVGGSREAVVGQPARAAFCGDNSWIADSIERAARTTDPALAFDVQIARVDAAPASVNLTTAPLIDAADKRIGSMLVMEDITAEKRVRSTMSRYMSAEVAEQLLAAGEDELIGKDQKVSVLFADVRGFTSIAESIGARETVAMLNAYFTEMVDVVLRNGGILDKYIGDAMMALFGAPFATARDADNAVATANQMMRALTRINAQRTRDGHPKLDIGIGVSTGEVIVGNIGSAKRMEYTVIGDNVNLASRLEGANKLYGSKILISEFTRDALGSPVLLREIDRIRVRGKARPVAIHESLQYRSNEIDRGLGAMLEAFENGLAAYRALEWEQAEAAFEQALVAMPGDGPSRVYRDRCRQFRVVPPPPDWDGVWALTSK